MSLVHLVLAAGAVFVGATVQRTLGFGAALVTVPLLLLIDPRLVPGPATVASAALGLLMTVGTHGVTDWRGVRWIVAGTLPGSALAGMALVAFSDDLLAATAAVLVLLAVAAVIAGRSPAITPATLAGSGVLSGFMGTTAAIAGPPLALLYHRQPTAVIRATLARIFLVSTMVTLLTLALADRLPASDWTAGLALMPGGAAGFVAGRVLSGRVDHRRLRVAALLVSALSAGAALVRVAL